MDIKNIAVKDLIPYEKNTKKHDDTQIANVAESIKQYGFVQPLVVDKNNVVVIGHCRLLAAKKLKMQEVPCVCVDDLTEEQVKALRIVDNKSNESPWDFDFLADELAEIDLSDFNFDFGIDTDTDEDAEIVEDEAPEVDEENEPITKLGDVWQLGRHRLMCGDSTDPVNIGFLMDGRKADLVFTDPPYGCGFESKGVLNDNQNQDDLTEFNKQWIPLTFEALKENGSWYCWGIDESVMRIYAFILLPMIKENKIIFRNLLTWDKGLGQNQNDANMRSYAAADEKCLFVMCGVQGFNNNADNYFEEYEPIRLYLEGEAKKADINAKKIKEICGVGMFSHWFTKSQWDLMSEEHYKKIQNYCVNNNINAFGVEFGKIKKQYDEIKKQYDEIKKQYDEIKKQWYETRAYFDNTHDNMNNVWHFSRTGGEERELTGGHATPKPIALCSRAIKSSSRENEIVLDVFGGSGSTLIACEQLDRTCYMMELDPKYCDVIIKRWETLTGEKAVLING